MTRTANRKKGGGRGKKFEDNGPTSVQRHGPTLNKRLEKKRRKNRAAAAAAVSEVPATSIPAPATSAVPTPTPAPTPAPAPFPASNGNVASTKGKEEEKGDVEWSSGFIFMCSGKTKPDCYKHRVFGLPSGQMHVVRNIKPGTKLFLYDFDLKLLYGIYKATSGGEHSLEPTAFGGRFPAQVRFKIAKDCLPLPESELKQAIPENYQGGSKFTPQLSNKQVKKLMAMFRPITLPPGGSAPPMSNVAPQQPPPSVMGERFRPMARPPPENTYTGPLHHARGPPLHPADGYYSDRHAPYLPDNPVQDPYSRFRAAQEMVPREQLYGRDGEYHHRPILGRNRETAPHLDRADNYYSSLRAHTASRPLVPSYGVPPLSYPPATSYGPPASHPPAELPYYYAAIAHAADPNRAYADPLQRSASGRVSATGGNVPVSSLYAFAGATPAYR